MFKKKKSTLDHRLIGQNDFEFSRFQIFLDFKNIFIGDRFDFCLDVTQRY